MSNPREFYLHRIKTFDSKAKQLQKKLQISSLARLLIFVSTLGAVYLVKESVYSIVAVVLVGSSIFIGVLLRHTKLVYQKKKALIKKDINSIELQILDRNYSQLPSGSSFNDEKHAYCNDIDLFGKNSFYQYSNRCCLQEGRLAYANLLKENSIGQIIEKQEAIKELGALPEWRQEYMATAKLIKSEYTASGLIRWMEDYRVFLPKKLRYIPLGFSLISGLLWISFALALIPGFFLFTWFIVGLGISGIYLQKINSLSQAITKVQDALKQHQQLLKQIQTKSFTSELLKSKRDELIRNNKDASKALLRFYRFLDALDQRNNLIVGIALNGFLLWDLRLVYNIETWIEENKKDLEIWVETMVLFDVYNSLGNFAFNHPSYHYPHLTSGKTVIKATNLGHPLLDPKESVVNDFVIKQQQFFIITGANMAGKSTFLRTISLFIVMSNIGLPVYADYAEYNPIKLITSMRTIDSLSSKESYFYAELKRLKFIVENIAEEQYFVLLDEILKGTNSKDKAAGSMKFVKKLVNSGVVGITATHDLSLCTIADEEPRVKNYYFDAQIQDDELYFDYRFKEGICSNMNASFLLEKMKIVDRQ